MDKGGVKKTDRGGVKKTTATTTKVRAANPEEARRAKKLAERRANARKKLEDSQKENEANKKRKGELQEQLANAKGEEAAGMKMELDELENKINQGDEKIRMAEMEVNNADKMDVDDEGNDQDPDRPKPKETIEENDTDKSDPSTLIMALLAGTALDDHPVPLDVSLGAGLSKHESVIGYKNGLGKVGIICNTEIEGWPVYRIRRNVVIGDKVPNIIKDRRAGTLKDEEAGTKWGWSDALAVRGIAIAVPSGYKGDVEDLVVPVPRYTAIQKEAMKLEKKPIPKQVDVQILIEWKTPKNGKVLSWESRTTSAALWKKATPTVLWEAAQHFEGYFRDGGGKDVAPFGMPNFGASLSPESSPDPDQLPSTKTTPGVTPDPQPAPDAKKKAARADFKSEWCEEMNIDPEKMTDADRGSFMASWTVYWAKLNQKSQET